MRGEGLVVRVELVEIYVPDAANAAAAAAVARERLLGRQRRWRGRGSRRGVGLPGAAIARGGRGHGRLGREVVAAAEERARRPGQERQDRARDTDDGAQHTAPRPSLVERGGERAVAEAKMLRDWDAGESNCHKATRTNQLANDTSCSVDWLVMYLC